jgi:hypothetical protein
MTTYILMAVHAERLNRHRTQVLIVALSLLNDVANVLELRLRHNIVEFGLGRLLLLGGHFGLDGQGDNKRKNEGIEDQKGSPGICEIERGVVVEGWIWSGRISYRKKKLRRNIPFYSFCFAVAGLEGQHRSR